MFGFSFGELCVLVVVAIVVIGPKDLPKVLRRLGQWAARARKMASELRVQSGIDEVLRSEGLGADIAEIRKLARGELEGVKQAARIDGLPIAPSAYGDPYSTSELVVDREREFPREGADAYRALPDTAIVYAASLPKSPLAKDPLYVLGDADAVVPDDPPPAVDPDADADAHPRAEAPTA